MIEINYMTLNAYAGGVGELLGVQLVSGLWLILLGLVFRKLGMRINAIISVVLGIAFALTAFRTVVPEMNALSATVPPFALVWLVALAVTFWRRASGSTA
jgi:predicted RND superfamily exporter protein